jgi:hypothetical protein
MMGACGRRSCASRPHRTLPKNTNAWIAIGVIGSFIALIAGIVWLRLSKVITFELTMLMMVALVGLYLGFGVLIAVYRFVRKLD